MAITADQYAQAIRDANGMVSVAARRLGCSRRSIYNARDRHAKVREALEDTRERTTDMAESKLYQLINEGNPTAIIFYLKCQARERGYIERQDHHHSGKIDVSRLTDDELDEVANGHASDARGS